MTQMKHVNDALFNVCGPLPIGTTVLEASAGTGKTFTIAALATRYVAAGTPLERLLLVTFTRMATGELRERVRDRLVSAEDGLARVLDGVAPPGDDDVLCLLADGSRADVDVRRRRLATALGDFDAATIATTHGFCQHILSGLGVAGDVEADIIFVDDAGDLVEEVVDDLYVRRFVRYDGEPLIGYREALAIGRTAVANPLAPIEPRSAPAESTWAMRARLAVAVREEVDRRKRRMKILTYDDLLTRLRATLQDPKRGPAACQRLRERYHVALVDEFQDTDPIQWEIMQRAFGQGGSTLVLIGDPKQAIYAFRGADVFAYLDAARDAMTRATLGINWRSDQGLIDAYDALLRDTKLGHEGIHYRTVKAANANQQARLVGAPHPAPLRVRIVHRHDGFVGLTPKGYANLPTANAFVASDVAGDVVALLASEARVLTRRDDGSEIARHRVQPGDVAVLVRTNRQAALIRDALDKVGVPAVINGAGSVMGTKVAREWLALLEALERPASPARAHSASLTVFLGWDAAQVAAADENAWETVHARLHRWAAVLRDSGVASLLETMTLAEGLPARILARPDGEREFTDLRHLGQLLHLECVSDKLGVTALAVWLRQRIAEAGTDTNNEDRSRRLESDAEAVQVLTIHRSKGLEFGIIYYPFLWDPGWIPDDAPAVFHDSDNERTIDVGQGGPGWPEHRRRFVAEQRGEDLRLAYVALTRARHQAVLWWAGSSDSFNSPLGRLLYCRDPDGNVAAEGARVPGDDEVEGRFEALAAEVPGRIAVERASGGDGSRWLGHAPPPGDLGVSRFDRGLDTAWRRTSYSAITAAAHEDGMTTEPDASSLSDESRPEREVATIGENGGESRLRAVASPLAAMAAGARVGSLIHAVLETSDFAAPDLATELAARLGEQQALAAVDLGDNGAALLGLQAAIETPMGPLVGGRRLRDFPRSDRLDELDFELPLVGGDTPAAELTVAAIAGVLRSQLPADDVLAGYPDRLADPALQADLRGYLAGSIDVVLRFADSGRDGDSDGLARYAIVDYKTNWLGAEGEDLSAWHYRPAALAGAMQSAHYPLQALLYSVALHRYLRWRLPGYSPARNLGGVLYLFLRGMTGASVPQVGEQPCGVFAWRPPARVVEALSDLLDRGIEIDG